jgi:hypothetical protein
MVGESTKMAGAREMMVGYDWMRPILAWGNLVNGVLSWMIFWPSGCLAGVSG